MDVRSDERAVEPLVALSFEGMPVTGMEGVLSSVSLTMPDGYPIGTHIRFEVEVRVANVRYEEGKGRHKGDFVRRHMFATEGVTLLAAFVPADQVEGSLGGSQSLVEDEDEPFQTPVQNEDVGF